MNNASDSAELYEYGITTEQSDYRAHVCFQEGCVYVYPTQEGREVCKSGSYPVVAAKQSGVSYATACGFLVPPEDIKNCQRIQLSPSWVRNLTRCVNRDSDTTTKGYWACRVFQKLLEEGRVAFVQKSVEITDHKGQIAGGDVRVKAAEYVVQVKCDWDGGVNGTGNLFLQTHESNPKKRH